MLNSLTPQSEIRIPQSDHSAIRSLSSHVNRHNPAGQVLVSHLHKSGVLHPFLQSFLVWKFSDRVGEVAVDAGVVFGDPGADLWEKGEGVEVVELAEGGAGGAGE